MRTGRECVALLEAGFRELERRDEAKYADRLTPTERKRINGPGPGEGNYHAFFRATRPKFRAGDWLAAGPEHHVQVAEVQPRPGKYRVVIGAVRDDRKCGPYRLPSTRNVEGDIETEPEGVDVGWLRRFAEDAEMKHEHRLREAIAE